MYSAQRDNITSLTLESQDVKFTSAFDSLSPSLPFFSYTSPLSFPLPSTDDVTLLC